LKVEALGPRQALLASANLRAGDTVAVPKPHLWSTPVAVPFCRTYDVPQQSSAACKALKVLKTTVLKRLGGGGSTPSLATIVFKTLAIPVGFP
jgi:hypothetical protein